MKQDGKTMKLKQLLTKEIKLKKSYPVLLTFFLLFFSVTVMMIIREIYPFGDNSMLMSDFASQYYPFMLQFRRMLLNGEGLFYAWNMGLGGDFYTLYTYYLSNPLNFLVVLVPEAYVLEFMTVLIILQISLCGTAFAYYLKKHFHREDYSVTVFGCLYGFSGFLCAYNWHIMWLGVVAMAPVVILKLERMLEERTGVKSGIHYALALAITMILNYYMAMHVCIFLVLYFLMQMVLRNEEHIKVKIRQLGRFAVFSVLAACLSGYILIPTVLGMRTSTYVGTETPTRWRMYYNFFTLIERHLAGVSPSLYSKLPNVYCGVIVLLLIPFFFFTKKISIREKAVYLIALILFDLTFLCNRFDFLAHGLNYPTCFPARNSFLYIFLLLMMAYKALGIARQEREYGIMGCSLGIAITLILISKLVYQKEEMVLNTGFFLSLGLIAAEAVLLLLLIQKRKNVYFLLFGMLIISEGYLNMFSTAFYTNYRKDVTQYYEDMGRLLNQIPEKEDFYRVGIDFVKGENESFIYQIDTDSSFTSTINSDVVKLYRKWGGFNKHVLYHNMYNTPIFHMLLADCYYVSVYDDLQNEHLIKLAEKSIRGTKQDISQGEIVYLENMYYLYQMKYGNSFGYTLYQTPGNEWFSETSYVAEMENALTQKLLSRDQWEITLLESQNLTASHVIEKQGIYYLYIPDEKSALVQAVMTFPDGHVSGRDDERYQNQNIIYLGELPAGTVLQVKYTENENMNPVSLNPILLRLDEETTGLFYELLDQNFTLTKRYRSELTGTADMKQAGSLILSMPVGEGWSLAVDGKQWEIESFADCLMKISLPEGKHQIRLTYRTPGFRMGAVLSLLSLTAVLLILFMKRNKKL